jgi:hypothetical protein
MSFSFLIRLNVFFTRQVNNVDLNDVISLQFNIKKIYEQNIKETFHFFCHI